MQTLLLLAAGAGLMAWLLFSKGSDAAEKDQMEQVLDDIQKAHAARDELERDPAAALRVRARFTRKFLRDLPARLHGGRRHGGNEETN
jgi:hypothetical protein